MQVITDQINSLKTHFDSKLDCIKKDIKMNLAKELKSLREHFMNNDVWRYAINELISHTEQCLQTQVKIDEVYEKICKTILGEMNRSGQYTEASSFSKKRHKKYKPHWNNCLTNMWKDMHRKEKNYRRYRGEANEKYRLKSVFIQ